jgi:transcriptional regulator of aromatic amino acid metabolism
MMLRPEHGYLYLCNIEADRLSSLHKDVGKPDKVTAVPSSQLLHDTSSHLKSRVLENAMPDQILTKLKQQP